MTQKYPEGAIVVDQRGKKRKVLGACGEMRFLSKENDYNVPNSAIFSVYEIDQRRCTVEATDGSTVEETPWVPGEDEKYFFVDMLGEVDSDRNTGHAFDKKCIACGNVFETKELAEQAAIRVRAAYIG